LNVKAVLLFMLLVFAFAPVIATLATTLVTPTINIVNLAKTATYDAVLDVQPTGDPVDPSGFPS